MKKPVFIFIAGLLLLCASAFAQDVIIDSDGNVTTGSSNTDGNLEVIGSSGEHGIVGSSSGTMAAGVYGVNTTQITVFSASIIRSGFSGSSYGELMPV